MLISFEKNWIQATFKTNSTVKKISKIKQSPELKKGKIKNIIKTEKIAKK